MRALKEVFAWLFLRLPRAFSYPFIALTLVWVFGAFHYLDQTLDPLTAAAVALITTRVPNVLAGYLLTNLESVVRAFVVILLFLAGFLVAYNISAGINWIFVRLRLKPLPYRAGAPHVPSAGVDGEDPLADVKRIGIVLAGGGAKGAFQAGAMKAIYRFLAEHGALDKVKVLASTSIGSWNALFWLADLIEAKDGAAKGTHELWWRSISAKSLAAPSWYFPLCRNAFLSSLPWRQVFDRLFGREQVRDRLLKTPIHFYLTRSEVRSGELWCATNSPNPPKLAHVHYERLDKTAKAEEFLEGIKAGVFASMDLPPLFPYYERRNRLFEDGGVVDNLPIVFAAAPEEHCDLVFILPLNSDFEETPNTTSLFARLLRVMDVRQGVLERTGFKLLYLYNELAALRKLVEEKDGTADPASDESHLQFALHRKNDVINVFAVCPIKAFVQETINTRDLWKKTEAGIAFDVMRDATAKELARYPFTGQNKIRVGLVHRTGHVDWDEDF